jgi:hypothetical protein
VLKPWQGEEWVEGVRDWGVEKGRMGVGMGRKGGGGGKEDGERAGEYRGGGGREGN